MSIILVAGQTKQLDVSLAAVILLGDIRVNIINLYPSICYPGDIIDIRIGVENYGGAGTSTITCLVNSTPIGSQPVTLDGGGLTTLRFSFTPGQIGTYTISADNKWAILTVMEKHFPVVFDAHPYYQQGFNLWGTPYYEALINSNIYLDECSAIDLGNGTAHITAKGNWKTSNSPYGGTPSYPPVLTVIIYMFSAVDAPLFENYLKTPEVDIGEYSRFFGRELTHFLGITSAGYSSDISMYVDFNSQEDFLLNRDDRPIYRDDIDWYTRASPPTGYVKYAEVGFIFYWDSRDIYRPMYIFRI